MDEQDAPTSPNAAPSPYAIPADALRWTLDPAALEFETTADVEPAPGIVGQDAAVEALRFGLSIQAPGQNIYVRGITGTGRASLTMRTIELVQPEWPPAADRCYVHNFRQVDRPRLLTLDRGQGDAFRAKIDDLIDFIERDLAPALSSDDIKAKRTRLEKETGKASNKITEPFEAELKEAGLGLVMMQMGNVPRPTLVPLVEGQPATAEQIEAMREGGLNEDELKALGERIDEFSQKMRDIGAKVQELRGQAGERLREILEQEARALLEAAVAPIRARWPGKDVKAFLDDIIEDVVGEHLAELDEETPFTAFYRVNVLHCNPGGHPCPPVIEYTPSVQRLLGTIDLPFDKDAAIAPHMMIRAGSLLRADRTCILLEARDILSEPGAWKALTRTLRTGRIELAQPESQGPWRVPALKPEPIPVQLKAVLMGDSTLYYMLDALDPDFGDLFKVLADFESVMPRSEAGIAFYAGVISRICKTEGLLPVDRAGVAALCEHGARIAAEEGKLTARFGRLADLLREASYLAAQEKVGTVTGDHVRSAIRRTKERASLPARRFREQVERGIIRVHTKGEDVGQINGLAVIRAGPLSYGFPNRITASIGPGTAGTINIERESELSGAIHTKGFFILDGLLRYLLRTDHPLAFNASITFEQSYGGIDGDSASGAEMCCLISALTDVPLRQDLAMTGAIDQVGNILPIGAVNEKIEGYYDVCRGVGFSGTQGVVIPRCNAGDLMLRHDVVESVRNGEFQVYAVDRIHDALTLFTGIEAGDDPRAGYAPDTLLGIAVARARTYWEQVSDHLQKIS